MSASIAPGQSKPSPKSHITPIVFVVDDDISVRESLELLIRSEGWEPETFALAQEFLARPRALVPSCLVLDVSLPGLNGLELQKRVAIERTDVPIIFITGYGDVPMTVQAMKAGAVEFLTKPFSADVLLSAIRNAIERSRTTLDQEAEIRALQQRYLTLTTRERQITLLKRPYFRLLIKRGAAALDCIADGAQQDIGAEWLGQELDSSGFHGLDSHRHVAVTRNEDD